MYKSILFLLISIFFTFGCKSNESLIKDVYYNPDVVTFDAVEKNYEINTKIPDNFAFLFDKWFQNKIRINGFDGSVTFVIRDYNEKISILNDVKRVDIILNFAVIINKSPISVQKFIEGEVYSYGTLEGNFSLFDFDKIIENTQKDLILRISRKLNSKI